MQNTCSTGLKLALEIHRWLSIVLLLERSKEALHCTAIFICVPPEIAGKRGGNVSTDLVEF
jgi:hypothetical protein